MTKQQLTTQLKNTYVLLYREYSKHKTEFYMAVFAICTMLLSIDKYYQVTVYENNAKELQREQERVMVLAKELNKYYLLEEDLVKAGASRQQARDMIKSSELVQDSDLASTQRGK